MRLKNSTGEEYTLTDYGIHFAKGGAIELLTLQWVESVMANDWAEEDGLEIHPKGILMTCPYIELRFVLLGKDSSKAFRRLFDSYYLILITDQGEAFHICNIAFEDYKEHKHYATATIRCRLKNGDQHGTEPIVKPSPLSRISFGQHDLTAYGIYPLPGAYSQLHHPSDFKPRTFKRKSRTITLPCFMQGASYYEMREKLGSFYGAVKGKPIVLHTPAQDIPCYYTAMTDLQETPTSSTNSRKFIFTLHFTTL